MLYSNKGQKTANGTSPTSLIGSTPGTDYVGFKAWSDILSPGYVGGGKIAGKALAENGSPLHTLGFKLGEDEAWTANFNAENGTPFYIDWFCNCESVNPGVSVTLIFAAILFVNGEPQAVIIGEPTAYAVDEQHGSLFLADFDLIGINGVAGSGITLEMMVIN